MRVDATNVWVVARREFMDRVRRKLFLVTTLIMPIIFGGLMVLPAVLSVMHTGKPMQVLVVDKTGWAGPAMVRALPASPAEADSDGKSHAEAAKGFVFKLAPAGAAMTTIRREIGDGKVDGALVLEGDEKSGLKGTYYGQNLSNPQLFQVLDGRLNTVLLEHRLAKLGLAPGIAQQLKGRVDLETVKVEKGGKTRKGSIMDFIMPFVLAMIIYMMIIMYGVAIMNGVLEEKNSKVVEVIVSAVRPFELMLGKIVGIASVGLLQYGIWITLGAFVYFANPMNFQAHLEGPPIRLTQLVVLVVYFLLGFVFYSSLYAAIGACCTTQQETQQLQMPVTFGLVIPFVLMMPTIMTPNASWVVALSLFPVTSPITMLLRVGSIDVPLWQLGTSVGLLAAGTVGIAWVAGKIFRVGILMTGKRPSIPEILRWVREK
jgi:ABC-2 type transport system permease protein